MEGPTPGHTVGTDAGGQPGRLQEQYAGGMIERMIEENGMGGIYSPLWSAAGSVRWGGHDVRGQGTVRGGSGRQGGRERQRGDGGRGAAARQSVADGLAGPADGDVRGGDAFADEAYLCVVAECGGAAGVMADVGHGDVRDGFGGHGGDGEALGIRGEVQLFQHEAGGERGVVLGVCEERSAPADGLRDEQRLMRRPVRRHV